MSTIFEFDAYSPSQIAERVQQAGVAKARLALLPLIMLGLLAGAAGSIGFQTGSLPSRTKKRDRNRCWPPGSSASSGNSELAKRAMSSAR